MSISSRDMYWEVIRKIFDPETKEVVSEKYVAQTDTCSYATMLLGIFEDSNKDPNVEYYIRVIPEPHPLRKHRRKELNLPTS